MPNRAPQSFSLESSTLECRVHLVEEASDKNHLLSGNNHHCNAQIIMSEELSRFVVVLEEDVGGHAELKYDVKATTMQEQQKTLIDAEVAGKMVVMADMDSVIHGTLSKGGPPATLIVMSFYFLPGSNSKRFKSAEIMMKFTKGPKATSGAEVFNIAPAQGVTGMEPTNMTVNLGHVLSPSLQVGQGPGSATLGYQWNFSKSFDKKRYARVESAQRALGKDRSTKNTVTWNLYENPVTHGGIPSYLRTAILLTREETDDEPLGEKFNATLKIHGVPGWRGRIKEGTDKIGAAVGGFFHKCGASKDENNDDDDYKELNPVSGSAEKSGEIIFNPTLSRGDIKNKDELCKEDLEKLKKVVMLYLNYEGA